MCPLYFLAVWSLLLTFFFFFWNWLFHFVAINGTREGTNNKKHPPKLTDLFICGLTWGVHIHSNQKLQGVYTAQCPSFCSFLKGLMLLTCYPGFWYHQKPDNNNKPRVHVSILIGSLNGSCCGRPVTCGSFSYTIDKTTGGYFLEGLSAYILVSLTFLNTSVWKARLIPVSPAAKIYQQLTK